MSATPWRGGIPTPIGTLDSPPGNARAIDAPTAAVPRQDCVVGIDAGRALGVIAVVLIHTAAARPLEFGIDAGRVIDQLCRWAVPFYFIASGFFLARRIDGPLGPTLRAIAARVGLPFLTWSALYLVASRGGPSRLVDPAFLGRWLVTGAHAWHLWFLPALATCLALLVLLHHRRVSLRTMALASLLLYVAGLCLGPYRGAFLSGPVDPAQLAARIPLLDGRGGPFPLAFVVAGYGIARGLQTHRWLGPVLLATGGVLHLAEAGVIDAVGWFPFAHNDLLLSTLAFGTGAFLVARDLPASPAVQRMAVFGRWSLGVYCCHVLFIAPLRGLLPQDGLADNLLLATVVLGVSAAVVALLARVPLLRPLLT